MVRAMDGQAELRGPSVAQLDRRAPTTDTANETLKKVQQPKPQVLPQRQGPTSVLVSPRQKGNPILNHIRSMPWEYSDIPADYVLGLTTCALFLSLKYHRLHPEYIYSRIRALQHKYNLRILLTMVDIENHEELLKELSKTSLINNVTIVLCWSAQEAGRYLELFKQFEHAAPTSIRSHQSTSYHDRMTEFITTPRSINKTDALGLVSNFGSIRTAMNARPEEVALVAGWGEKKVQRWCQVVREPFRVQKAAKRGLGRADTTTSTAGEISLRENELEDSATFRPQPVPISNVYSRSTPRDVASASAMPDLNKRRSEGPAEDDSLFYNPEEDEGEAMREAMDLSLADDGFNDTHKSKAVPAKQRPSEDEPSEGILAALAKLRQQ